MAPRQFSFSFFIPNTFIYRNFEAMNINRSETRDMTTTNFQKRLQSPIMRTWVTGTLMSYFYLCLHKRLSFAPRLGNIITFFPRRATYMVANYEPAKSNNMERRLTTQNIKIWLFFLPNSIPIRRHEPSYLFFIFCFRSCLYLIKKTKNKKPVTKPVGAIDWVHC